MLPSDIAGNIIEHLSPTVDLELFKKVKRQNPTNLYYSFNIFRSIKQYSPDVVHIQCSGHAWFCFVLPFVKAANNKIVFTVHDPLPHPGEETFVRNMADRFVRSIGDHFIVHANALKDQMIDIYHIEPDNIDVVPIGNYNFNEDQTNNHFIDQNNILFFGRIADYKGIEYLIAAEPFISKCIDNFTIIIAGTGKNLRPYLDRIENRMRFVVINKHISEKGLQSLIQSASFLVLPYTEASQSGIIPLAYSYHKPVITTDVGGLSEVVDDGITGKIVPPRDTDKLAEAICMMLKNKDLTRQMGENAYQKQKTDLSWNLIAQKSIEVYSRCLKKQE
jgi:glycosyltransferase involved in cell wall biosynthesis